MKIGIYGREIDKTDMPVVECLFNTLKETNTDYVIEAAYYNKIKVAVPEGKTTELFSNDEELIASGIDCLISLGGDGTLLDTLSFVKNTSIPVIGINLGRLGFLSNISKEKIPEAIYALHNGHYKLEKRSMLELKSTNKMFKPVNYALNDFTIHKRDTGSMIAIDTYLNGDFFNTYWADGIIVSTPTGSTAYSLSCGGPVIFPDSNNFVITAVAPHHLNIRPIIVSDSTVISFRVRGRGTTHLISMDSRYEIIENIKEIAIQKAPFYFNLIKLSDQNFITTLREKLKWGWDTRNL